MRITRNGYYLIGGALAVCVLAALAGFDGGVPAARAPRALGASLADAGVASTDADGGSVATSTRPDRDTMRPTIVDSFPTEAVVPGWSDVNERELQSRLAATLGPVEITVSRVECRQRSCYIDVQGTDPRTMMAARDVFFAMLSGLSVRSCQFGSLGLDEATLVQRLYLYCHPDTRPNFAYYDSSRNVTESVTRLRATLDTMNAAPEEDGT